MPKLNSLSNFDSANVVLWRHHVGVLAESTTGEPVFDFAPEFQKPILDISPIELPVSVRGPQVFPELDRNKTFQGLPGVFSDSLPDAFGSRLIRLFFE